MKENGIVKLYMPIWNVKYPKDYVWHEDKEFAVKKSFNRPKKRVGDLQSVFKNIMMPDYMEESLFLVSEDRNERFNFFKQLPITTMQLDIDKIANRKGIQYAIYNKAIELNMYSIYWVVDKEGEYHHAPFDFNRFTNYELPKSQESLENQGFLSVHKEPEEGDIGTVISQIGKDNVAGVLKMTKISVEGRIANVPFKHDVDESFEDFSFLSITAYI